MAATVDYATANLKGSLNVENSNDDGADDGDIVTIDVCSAAGISMCTLDVPRHLSVLAIKERIAAIEDTAVTLSDMLCLDGAVLQDPSSQPLLDADVEDGPITLMLCFTEDFDVGDSVHYIGPSDFQSELRRGSVCTVVHGPDKNGYAGVQINGQAVHLVFVTLLRRSAPDVAILPGGYKIGDVLYYTGPELHVLPLGKADHPVRYQRDSEVPQEADRRPRSFIPSPRVIAQRLISPLPFKWAQRCSELLANQVLRPGMQVKVLEAGVIENSVRVKFLTDEAPTAIAVSVDNLSSAAPHMQSSCASLLSSRA